MLARLPGAQAPQRIVHDQGGHQGDGRRSGVRRELFGPRSGRGARKRDLAIVGERVQFGPDGDRRGAEHPDDERQLFDVGVGLQMKANGFQFFVGFSIPLHI